MWTVTYVRNDKKKTTTTTVVQGVGGGEKVNDFFSEIKLA